MSGAGEFHVKAAALVLPNFSAHGGHSAGLACEHSRHPGVCCVHSEAEARAWLAGWRARG